MRWFSFILLKMSCSTHVAAIPPPPTPSPSHSYASIGASVSSTLWPSLPNGYSINSTPRSSSWTGWAAAASLVPTWPDVNKQMHTCSCLFMSVIYTLAEGSVAPTTPPDRSPSIHYLGCFIARCDSAGRMHVWNIVQHTLCCLAHRWIQTWFSPNL